MPKFKVTLPNRRTVPTRRKFKMGGRKNGKSALDMTTEELVAIATNKDSGKKRTRAQQILDKRGFDMAAHVAEMVAKAAQEAADKAAAIAAEEAEIAAQEATAAE